MPLLTMDNPDILTLSQVATYLKVAEKTISRMVHRHEIPCVKVGGQWRFMKNVIDEWLMQRMLPAAESGSLASIVEQSETLPLSRFVKSEWMNLNLEPGSKVDILAQMIAPLLESGLIQDEQKYLQLLLNREEMMSTAVGQGIALPHIRHPEQNPFSGPAILVGRCKEGADFGSPDGSLVHLFFLLIVKSEAGHVRVLAKLAQLVRKNEWRKRFLEAESADGIIRIFLEAEQATLT